MSSMTASDNKFLIFLGKGPTHTCYDNTSGYVLILLYSLFFIE